MKIHEYQAKEILRKYGVAVPAGEMAISIEEADTAAKALFSAGHAVVVVKAQIHAGGRGKAGGVKLAKSPDEALNHAGQILGMTLVTPQTGEEGRVVRRLLIEEGLDIKRELYVGVLVDREVGAPIFMVSAAGGMEIEEVAKDNPEAILREKIDPTVGFQPFQARKLAFGLGLTPEQVNAAKELKFKVPVVVRMEGTNVKQGKEILKNSGFNFTVADGMKDGAQKVVALAGGAQ